MMNAVTKVKLFCPLRQVQKSTFRQTFSTFLATQKSTLNDENSRRMSHTSFGIPGLESEDGDVGHTPIFSQSVLVIKAI